MNARDHCEAYDQGRYEGDAGKADRYPMNSLDSLPSLSSGDYKAFNCPWTVDSLPSIGPDGCNIRSLDDLPRLALNPNDMPGVQEVHAMLGCKHYAEIYHCSFKDENEQVIDVALKVLDKKIRPEDTRAKLMSQLNHPHLVRLHAAINFIPCGLALEFFPAGSLKAFLRGLLDRESCLSYTVQTRLHGARGIASALEYLHSLGVGHGEVQTESCFLTQKAKHGILPALKLGELGPVFRTSRAMDFMSPEVITHDASADIFAFGILLYELLTGQEIGTSAAPKGAGEAMPESPKGTWPPVEIFSTFKLRAEICNLIEVCCDEAPRRISASTLRSHLDFLIPLA